MPTPLPHRYDVGLAWEGQGGARLVSGGRPSIEGGAPPQFEGEEGWWSPEHLLLSALNLCLMTTFQALCRKARLEVLHYESKAEGVLDKITSGLGFTYLILRVGVRVAEADAEKARQLVLTAKRHCIVANVLTPPVHLELTVNGD